MGHRAIPVSQETRDNLQKILGDDGIAVEPMAGESTDGAGSLFRQYRCASGEEGVIVLSIGPCGDCPPFEYLCTLEFAGWSFSSKHQRLHNLVADRLEVLADSG